MEPIPHSLHDALDHMADDGAPTLPDLDGIPEIPDDDEIPLPDILPLPDDWPDVLPMCDDPPPLKPASGVYRMMPLE